MNIAPTRFLSFLVKGQLGDRKRWKRVPDSGELSGKSGFKGIVRQGATVCLISLCSLGLVDIKVKFQVSSTFRFQMFWCLHACSQQISSEGSTSYKNSLVMCHSFISFRELSSVILLCGRFVCVYIYIYQRNRDNFLFLWVPGCYL